MRTARIVRLSQMLLLAVLPAILDAQPAPCLPAPGFKVLKTIELGGLPKAVAFSSDQKFALVSLLDQNVVAVIDLSRHEIVGKVKVGRFPAALAVSPDSKQVFVANARSNTISVIDVETQQVIRTLENVPSVISLAFGAGGRLLYGVSPTRDSRGVLVINTSSANPVELVRRITDAHEQGNAGLREQSTELRKTQDQPSRLSNPMAVAFAPDGQRLYVVNPFARNVTVISTATRRILANIPLSDVPWGIAITPDGGRLLVTFPKSGTVGIVGTKQGHVLDTISVGKAPISAVVSKDGCWGIITIPGSSSVSVIEIASGYVTSTLSLPNSTPGEIALAPDGRFAYVTNAKGRNVLVLGATR